MRNIVILFVLLLGFQQHCLGQDQGVLLGQARHFMLMDKNERIDFIKFDTALSVKKPVFLFCQGSLPVPLAVHSAQYGDFIIGGGITNFDLKNITRHYHVIVISMPETPLLTDEKNLNGQYCYVPDTTQKQQLSKAFLEADYLEHYVQRAKRVWKYLKKQPWVDASRLVVAGHSQGSKVATKIARSNKSVTHLGLFGANPFGRVDQFVREARLNAQLGKMSWEAADQEMEAHYQEFQKAYQPDSVRANPGLLALKTFSEPFYDDWLQLNIPIYLAYGTEDRTADLCDLMPLFFIQAEKHNLHCKRYLKLEHNFFEVAENGRPDYNKGHWPEVMQAFVDWSLK